MKNIYNNDDECVEFSVKEYLNKEEENAGEEGDEKVWGNEEVDEEKEIKNYAHT
jgi:hypothetical protein